MSRILRPSVLVWFGLAAAPAAWTVQHLVGVGLTIGRCHDNTAGPGWDVPVDAGVIVATAAAAAVGVLGAVCATAAWRAARDADDDDAPPQGRNHFLGIIGMTTSPLFVAIILMSGIGTLFLPQCVQS